MQPRIPRNGSSRRAQGNRNVSLSAARNAEDSPLVASSPAARFGQSPAAVHVDQPAVPRNGARVVVAIPSTGDIHRETYRSVRAMIDNTKTAERVTLWWENDRPHDRCRNQLIRRFLAEPAWTHLLFVDSDMVVPIDGVDRLLACNAPIAAGPAPLILRRVVRDMNAPLYGVTTNVLVLADPGLRGKYVSETRLDVEYVSLDADELPDQPFACDATGLAFCLIARDVFRHVTEPWCQFVGDLPQQRVGEDVYFFRKARGNGFTVTVDPGAMCDHLKPIDLTHPDRFYCNEPPESNWSPPELISPPNVLVMLASNGERMWRLRTLDVIRSWQRRFPGCIDLASLDASDPEAMLRQAATLNESNQRNWSHALLLGNDVVPPEDLLDGLCSVDAPIASALFRGLFDGRLAYGFWQEDPLSQSLVAPQNIDLPAMIAPFAVDAVDPSSCLIRREALAVAGDMPNMSAVVDADHDPSGHGFTQAWCRRVQETEGAKHDTDAIAVIPMTVERWSETGLLAWLRLKSSLKQQVCNQRAQSPSVLV